MMMSQRATITVHHATKFPIFGVTNLRVDGVERFRPEDLVAPSHGSRASREGPIERD